MHLQLDLMFRWHGTMWHKYHNWYHKFCVNQPGNTSSQDYICDIVQGVIHKYICTNKRQNRHCKFSFLKSEKLPSMINDEEQQSSLNIENKSTTKTVIQGLECPPTHGIW